MIFYEFYLHCFRETICEFSLNFREQFMSFYLTSEKKFVCCYLTSELINYLPNFRKQICEFLPNFREEISTNHLEYFELYENCQNLIMAISLLCDILQTVLFWKLINSEKNIVYFPWFFILIIQ